MAGLQPSDRPTLHFLHLLLPHAPWRYLPSGTEYNFETFGRAFKSDRLPARCSGCPTSSICSRSPTPTA